MFKSYAIKRKGINKRMIKIKIRKENIFAEQRRINLEIQND